VTDNEKNNNYIKFPPKKEENMKIEDKKLRKKSCTPKQIFCVKKRKKQKTMLHLKKPINF